jgi:hypothetical protein
LIGPLKTKIAKIAVIAKIAKIEKPKQILSHQKPLRALTAVMNIASVSRFWQLRRLWQSWC